MSIKHISFVAEGVIKTAYIDQYPFVMLTYSLLLKTTLIFMTGTVCFI